MVKYLDAKLIVAVKHTILPPNPYAMGYGKAIPTAHMVKLKGDRNWRRVYTMLYSNAGSPYIKFGKDKRFLDGDSCAVIEEAK